MPEACPRCAGTGKISRYVVCPDCKGNGKVRDGKKPDKES